MNELKIFENPQFGEIRVTDRDGEPWFVAADVCRALDIGNPSQALTRLDSDEATLISNDKYRQRARPLCTCTWQPKARGESLQALGDA